MFKLGQRVTLVPKSWSEFRDVLSKSFAKAMISDEFSSTHKEMILVAGVLYGEDDPYFDQFMKDGGEIVEYELGGWYRVRVGEKEMSFYKSVLCLKEDMRSVDEQVFMNCLLL